MQQPNIPPRVQLEAPPDPLPTQWARATANSIAAELRRGWRSSTAKRAISSRGNPITGRDYAPSASFNTPIENTELLWRDVYQVGLVDPIPTLGVPYIAWHLTQLDLAEAVIKAGLMHHAREVELWLQLKPDPSDGGRPASPYRVRPNRHGAKALRRNTDYAPPAVANVFDAAVTAATIWLPDPLDVADYLAEYDRIDLWEVLSAAS